MKALLAQADAMGVLLSEDNPDHQAIRPQVLDCVTALIERGEYQRALALLDRLRTRQRVDGELAEPLDSGVLRVMSLLRLERTSEAAECVQVLLESWATISGVQVELWAQLRALEGGCFWRRQRLTESIERLESLRSDLIRRPDSRATCMCAIELMAAYSLAGDRSRARATVLEAWVAARRCGSSYHQAVASLNLAMLERHACHWSAAREAVEAALRQFREDVNETFERLCLRQLAIIDWKRGRLSESLALSESITSAATSAGMQAEGWLAVQLSALNRLHLGHFEAARKSLADDKEWAVPSKFSRHSLLTAEYLGDIDLEQGNAKAALARYIPALTQALALVPRGDVVAELRRRIAECHLLLGDPARALAEATDAIALCREIHERYDEAATHRVIALAHVALGRHAEAKKAFDAGFAEYDEIETPYEWGKLWLAYGDWLAADSSESYRSLSGAREAYVAALDHFERMGAEYRLAQARARLATLDETMRLEGATYAPTHGKVRPARRPRHSAEVLRRSQWVLDTFGLVTRSGPLLDMLHELSRVAVSDLPVLILGESGTGKELVAKGVHLLSGRTGEFLAINCSAVPEAMLEGEFFGYMKGSFTNAVSDKPGLFEVAHEGTVFLDEIGEMSPDLQAKLLRFLETGTLRRVGATRDVRVDTRIVAATNRERAALQSGNGFRSDLYYRLAHAVYELPPLRARGDDIELLIDHFLATFNRIAGKNARFGEAALTRMLQYTWPGNVRELQAVVRKLVVAAAADAVFTPRDLPLIDDGETRSDFIGETLANEKKRIQAALEQAHWVKTEAANILRISRTTLLSKMKRMGIEG